jgi:UDP-GlcNAc3NAcA epimerase
MLLLKLRAFNINHRKNYNNLRKKILTVIGARPQFIKASVVSHAISRSKELEEVLVHTGQHYDSNMSDVFFTELGMPKPDFLLNINGGTHAAMTGRMMEEVEGLILASKPHIVLLYGDTNSTLAGALAAAKLNIPIAHVEAGLRSFNLAMPEEINRILTDRISRWLFTPTAIASGNLRKEGVSPAQIEEVGDVMYDVALHHGSRVSSEGRLLRQLELHPHTYAVATVHRAENTDQKIRLVNIIDGLEAMSQSMPIIWPLHPRTRSALERTGRIASLKNNVRFIDPVGYLDMVQLVKYSSVMITDSGGLQKEAFFFGVPCVTLRDETEWTELVFAGWNRIAPPKSPESVRRAIEMAIGSKGQSIQPYGKGDAAEKIVKILVNSI